MLGDPVPVIAERVRESGEVDAVAERVGAGGSFGDRGLIKDAQAHLIIVDEGAGIHAFRPAILKRVRLKPKRVRLKPDTTYPAAAKSGFDGCNADQVGLARA